MKLNYSDIFVTFATNKLEVTKDFYSQILARKPIVYRPEIYAEFQLEKLRLAIFQPKTEHQAKFANHSSAMSLCIEVDNLVQAIACISDLGYPPPGEVITASHGQEIYAYDPDGNRLILHQSLNK